MKGVILRNLIAAVLIAIASGCYIGRNFQRPTAEDVTLDKTTSSEVLHRYGKPRQTGTMVLNENSLKLLIYTYAIFKNCGGVPSEKDLAPVKQAVFYTLNDILVGWDFCSTFRVDNTDFDETRLSDIRKGHTTRQEVICMLGTPSGVFVYPLTKEKGHTKLFYRYAYARGHLMVSYSGKEAAVVIDGNDVVVDVEFRSIRTE